MYHPKSFIHSSIQFIYSHHSLIQQAKSDDTDWFNSFQVQVEIIRIQKPMLRWFFWFVSHILFFNKEIFKFAKLLWTDRHCSHPTSTWTKRLIEEFCEFPWTFWSIISFYSIHPFHTLNIPIEFHALLLLIQNQ